MSPAGFALAGQPSGLLQEPEHFLKSHMSLSAGSSSVLREDVGDGGVVFYGQGRARTDDLGTRDDYLRTPMTLAWRCV